MRSSSSFFADIPVQVSRAEYESAAQKMADRVFSWPDVESAYQIGGVSTPGISDLDLVVVFKDGTRCLENPLRPISALERYLFAHNLYGVTVSRFIDAQKFSFFHDYRLLRGVNHHPGNIEITQEDALKKQIALEYLVRMYLNLLVQRVYGVYKLRGMFLHVKAVLYDLDFLGITTSDLFDLTTEIVRIRNSWFSAPVDETRLNRIFSLFFDALADLLKKVMSEQGFYLPAQASYIVGRLVHLSVGKHMRYKRTGILLPRVFRHVGAKYFNLQNRVGSFEVALPIRRDSIPEILAERFRHVEEMRAYNSANLPFFDPLVSSLDVRDNDG